MKGKFENCTMCDSKGVYEDYYDDAYGDSHYLGLFECSYCEGTGEVDIEKKFKIDVRVNKKIKKFFKKIN